MSKKKKKFLLTAIVLTVVTLLFTVAVKQINVETIGPCETNVGFAKLNGAVASAIGADESGFTYSEKLYDITEKLGYAAFLWIGVFGIIGLVQLIGRKSLKKVDPEIYAIAAVYFLTAVVYVVFEKVVINCRPVLMTGETVPEPSFPSTHTMMALVLWLSAAAVIGQYVKSKPVSGLIRVLSVAAACVEILCRALSGVHWATDIIGGLFFGAALLAWFLFILYELRRKRAKRRRARA